MNKFKSLSARYLLVALSLPVQGFLFHQFKGIPMTGTTPFVFLGVLAFLVSHIALLFGMFMFATDKLSPQKERRLDIGPTMLGVFGCLLILQINDGSLWRLGFGLFFVALAVMPALARILGEKLTRMVFSH